MRNKMFQIVLLIILSFSFCKKANETKANLEPGIGAMAFMIKGDVKAYDATGASISLQPKVTKFYSEHKIETGANSHLDVLLYDATVIRIYENTKLSISDLLLDSQGASESQIKLASGKLFVKTPGKLPKNRDIKVVTLTTVAGVRGTEFLVVESNEESKVLVGEGSVEGGTIDGESQVIEAGEKLNVVDAEATVSALDDAEKQELQEESQSVGSIVESGRAEIQNILQQFQEERQKILNEVIEKREENKQLIDEQKIKIKNLWIT
nr:LipL45 protein [Leptospira sp. GIMC2001]